MFRKLSIASGFKSSSGVGSSGGQGGQFYNKKEKKGKTVKYTPYSKHLNHEDDDDDDDLDEVAVISNTIPENVTYGSGQQHSVSGSSNGPRLVPGIITSTGFESKPYVPPSVPFAPKISSSAIQSVAGHRKSLTGGTLEPVLHHSDSKAIINTSTHRKLPTSEGPSTSSTFHHPRAQQAGGQHKKSSEIETISSRINAGVTHHESRIPMDEEEKAIGSASDFSLLVPKAGPPSEPSSTAHGEDEQVNEEEESGHVKQYVTKSGTRVPLIDGKKGGRRKSDQKNDNNKSRKDGKEGGRKGGEKEVEKWESSTLTSGEKSGCNWSFVFDPSGRLIYYWSMIVSMAFIYNSWVILYRFAFEEINAQTMTLWLTLDGIADFIYVTDIAVHFRIGYLEEGVLQTDGTKLRQHYMNSTMFYIDCLCLLPLDFLYLSIGFNSMLRCFRLVKIYRFWAFLDRTERHTNYPNVFRTLSLFHYILVLFHWNACLYHLIAMRGGFGSRDWFEGSRVAECSDVECDYLHAFYWSTLALTTIGDLPRPRTKGEYIFLIIELVLGLFLLATVLGHVANIVTNVSAARKEFQAKLDSVKTYMRMRRVPEHLKIKVIKWFDYLWMTQKSADEDKCVGFLPAKLKAEIAIHVHLDTLKRVEIFQNTEAGFLCALVLRLKPVLFSPSDYVCRKGEIGKEMYIVNRGKLQVVTDNGKTVLATLRAGSYFGEISILNMGNAGNRRTASVRSVGYSDLFCLNKHDMWEVLKDYPAARIRLEAIAVKRLEKYRKDPLKKSDENEILESVANRTLLSRSPKPPSTPRPDDDGMELYEQESLASSDHSEPDFRKTKYKNRQQHLKPPSFGVTPASPTAKSAPIHEVSGEQAGAHQFFLSTTPSNWYERRTSSPQTPGEVLMATISPIRMVQPGQQQHGSFVALRPLSPTASSPHLAIGTHLNIPDSSHPSVSGSISSFGSGDHHSQRDHHQPRQDVLSTPKYPAELLPRTPVPGELSQDVLVHEIKRLREKLHLLESENTAMTVKLSTVHSEFEGRLAEIESQMVQSHPSHFTDTVKLTTEPKNTMMNEPLTRQVVVDSKTSVIPSLQQSNNQSISSIGPQREQQLVSRHEHEASKQIATSSRSDVTSPISEVSNASSDHTPSSSCGSEELSERNRESII